MNILNLFRKHILKSRLSDNNNYEYGTKEEYNEILKESQSTKKTEINYSFPSYIADSQAFLTYHMAYNRIYDEYAQKYKENSTENENESNNNFFKLFQISQSAFMLGLTSFQYSIIFGYIHKDYLKNIVSNKMREFKINYDDLSSLPDMIKVQLEVQSFYDNSLAVRMNIKDLNVSNAYIDLLNKELPNFKHFIKNASKLAKDAIDKHLTEEIDKNSKSFDSFKKLVKNENFNLYEELEEKDKQDNNYKQLNKVSEEIYEYQSNKTLEFVNFSYISSYFILMENFKNNTIIDITDIEQLFENLDITSVKKINHIIGKKNITNHKVNHNIKTKEDFYNFLLKNKMFIKIAKKPKPKKESENNDEQ